MASRTITITPALKYRHCAIARPLAADRPVLPFPLLASCHGRPHSERDSGCIERLAEGEPIEKVGAVLLTAYAPGDIHLWDPSRSASNPGDWRARGWQIAPIPPDACYSVLENPKAIEAAFWNEDTPRAIRGERVTVKPYKHLQFALVRPRGNLSGFPVDMLRYDNCSPASPAQGAIITGLLNRDVDPPDTPFAVVVSRVVESASGGTWTDGRWQSFGWMVEPMSPADAREVLGL